MHLGKALENNDWEAIRKDLNRLPIEGIDGSSSKDKILNILLKYGIQSSSPSGRGQVRVEIWGSGKPMREFLWSEDMADACVFLMENRDFKDIVCQAEPAEAFTQRDNGRSHSELDSGSHQVDNSSANGKGREREIRNTHINIGTGKDISIKDLAELIKKTVGFTGKLVFNTQKPDGTMKKLTDVSKLKELGWEYKVELEEGLESVYKWYN